jgi:hypothetical protein
MNDARLKDAERVDYFEELLARIRDIRSSEKRFYQKLRDLFKASSSDYDGSAQTAKTFFATIQNKLVFAITGQTASELIVARADPAAANMALTNWPGPRIRKADVVVSKNYLRADELDQLNRLVTMFLDFAEDRALRRIETRMGEWIAQTDRFLSFNERSILSGAGRISHDRMESILDERFAEFDARRRDHERLTAERDAVDDLAQLESAATKLAPEKRAKDPKKS